MGGPPSASAPLYGCAASGLCAYILPAVSAAKHAHFHGMLRLPRSECPPDAEWVPVEIQEDSSPLKISVPPILRTLLWKKPDSPQSTFGNIHLRHTDRRVELLTAKSGQSVLSYWNQNRDGEHQSFRRGSLHAVGNASRLEDTTRARADSGDAPTPACPSSTSAPADCRGVSG